MTEERRSCDHYGDGHSSPCKNLMTHTELETSILIELHEIKANQEAMKEILLTWNNAKGWYATMKSIGVLLLWIAAVGAAVAAVGA